MPSWVHRAGSSPAGAAAVPARTPNEHDGRRHRPASPGQVSGTSRTTSTPMTGPGATSGTQHAGLGPPGPDHRVGRYRPTPRFPRRTGWAAQVDQRQAKMPVELPAPSAPNGRQTSATGSRVWSRLRPHFVGADERMGHTRPGRPITTRFTAPAAVLPWSTTPSTAPVARQAKRSSGSRSSTRSPEALPPPSATTPSELRTILICRTCWSAPFAWHLNRRLGSQRTCLMSHVTGHGLSDT